MGESGCIPFAAPHRECVAATIAGALAEHSIARLTIADPRACRARELACRGTNLPTELVAAAPGTTLSGAEVALLIEEERVCWVAGGGLARAFGEMRGEAKRE